MGKWTKFKGILVKFAEDASYQQKVDQLKPLAPNDRAGRLQLFTELHEKKDVLKRELEDLNLRMAAVDQLLVEDLENQEEFKISTPLGTFSLKDSPYVKLENQRAFLSWIHNTGQEDLLTVNYQTMSAMAKDSLEKGGDLPPGTTAYMKTSVSWYKPR